MWFEHVLISEDLLLRVFQEETLKNQLATLLELEVNLYTTREALDELHALTANRKGLLAADNLLACVRGFIGVISKQPIGVIATENSNTLSDEEKTSDFPVLSFAQIIERIYLEKRLLQQNFLEPELGITAPLDKKFLVIIVSAFLAVVGATAESPLLSSQHINHSRIGKHALISAFLPPGIGQGYAAYQIVKQSFDDPFFGEAGHEKVAPENE